MSPTLYLHPSAPGGAENTVCPPVPARSSEYSRLLAGLENVVMPELAQTAARLRDHGYTITTLEQRGPLATLAVKGAGGVRGWIYFQIHRSFSPLLENQRVFWMYSVHRPHQSVAGRPGRLPDLENAGAIHNIVAGFAALFEGGPATSRTPGDIPVVSLPGSIPLAA